MARADRLRFPALQPNLQISFYYKLQTLREQYLHEALKSTVAKLDIRTVDAQLSEYVDGNQLSRVASFGLRGEVFFPVPCVIEHNPFLLGYYRLLLGFSQKEVYTKKGLGRFKHLEERGEISPGVRDDIPELCACLVTACEILVAGIDDLSLAVAHDLQLLTIGPQLRGSENTRLGQDASVEFFELLKGIVRQYIKDSTRNTLVLENDSKRPVLIEFASDPDVRITEKLETHSRPLVSIEIKGGTDYSNVHNRLGEAEKSHQKARNLGFFEFWTVIRLDVEPSLARRESPTTSHFFHLDRIRDSSSDEHKAFKAILGSILGIIT